MPRIVISAPDRAPQPYRFPLDGQSVSLGRGEDNDVVIPCSSVSGHHAVMERVPGGFQLRDLNSTNGLTLDGVIQTIIPLANGVSVKIGQVPFDFTLSEDELVTLAGESAALLEAPIHKPKSPDSDIVYAASQESNPALRFVGTLVFLILLVVTFFFGVSLRYAKEKPGRSVMSLLHDMKSGGK
jgi:FHA domain